MTPKVVREGEQAILYDGDWVEHLEPWVFEPARLEAAGLVRGTAGGRGQALFFRFEGRDCVLRHYRRGGLLGGLLVDRYLWTGLERTRAWREWHLLAYLRSLGLPVPAPLAARVVRDGRFYRADLITERIPESRPLSGLLAEGRLAPDQWKAVGACMRRFHDAGIDHADLNAHNILIDTAGRIFVIDFDRGEVRAPGHWQQDNLDRLLRSLRKLATSGKARFAEPEDWAALMAGYASPQS